MPPPTHLWRHGPRLCSASLKERCAASEAEHPGSIHRLTTPATARHTTLRRWPRARMTLNVDMIRRLATIPARALLHLVALCQRAQGRPDAGWAPAVHCAKPACQETAQRHTGEARQPAFPAQWFDGLCRALPGERCTIAPVALQIADARTRSGRRITARLDAQTPGVRTTRFCRTHVTAVVCAPAVAHGRPPCDASRADVTRVHRSSPHVS
jgi:hypothetical protein